MTTLQTVARSCAHYLVPASIRDIANGGYHIIKGDAKEEHYQKMIAGAIRVSLATAYFFIEAAMWTLLPAPGALIVSVAAFIIIQNLDREIALLSFSAELATGGISSVARGIDLVAHKAFGLGQVLIIFGGLEIGAGWFFSRVPRDIERGGRGILADEIDGFAKEWGYNLYHKLNPQATQ